MTQMSTDFLERECARRSQWIGHRRNFFPIHLNSNPLHLCPSVKSAVKNLSTTDDTDEHRFFREGVCASFPMDRTSSEFFPIHINSNPLHLCLSVKSVVKNL